MGRGIFFIFVFTFSLTLRSDAGICDALLRGAKTTGAWAGKAVMVGAKFAFYPVVAPAQFVTRGVREGVKKPSRLLTFPFRYFWGEKYYLSALLTVAIATEGTYVSGLEFVQRTESLVPERLDAPIVVVDGFGSKLDIMRLSATYLEVLGYPNHTNVHVINPRNAGELVSELKRIRAHVGQIALMDYVGHGSPGVALLAGERLDPESITPLQDVFEKDATIRLMNCRLGSGCSAEKYLGDLGSVFLDRGGRVIASQKYVATGPSDVAIAAARALVSPETPFPDWVVSLSKFTQSPWMIPYAQNEGVTGEYGGWFGFIENEFRKLDFTHIDIPGRQ